MVGSEGSRQWLSIVDIGTAMLRQSFPWVRLRRITKSSWNPNVNTDTVCRKYLL